MPPQMSSMHLMCNSGLENAYCITSTNHIVFYINDIGIHVHHLKEKAISVSLLT